MADLYLDGQPVSDSRVELARPWRQRLWLGWGRVEERPALVSVGRARIEPPEGGRGRLGLPNIAGLVTWHDLKGHHQVLVEIPARPSESDTWFLGRFARALAAITGDGPLAVEQIAALPLFDQESLLSQFEEQDLDKLLARSLGAIATVCARPRSWLREEELNLPTERVRRVSRRAIPFLVRHPEYAVFDRLRVRPQRLLAVVQEEELDLYENRVAVSLVRQLLERAERRLARLERALEQFHQIAAQLQRSLRYGHFRRGRALCDRVGMNERSLWDFQERGLRLAGAFRLQIRTLRGCLAARLGLALRDAPSVTGAIKPTNILLMDPNYAVIEPLWRALEAERRARQSLHPVHDDPDRAYADFCILLAARALYEIGFTARPGQHIPLAISRASTEDGNTSIEIEFFKPDEGQVAPWDQASAPTPRRDDGRPARGGARKAPRRPNAAPPPEPTGWRAVLGRQLGDQQRLDRGWLALERQDTLGRRRATFHLDLGATFTAEAARPDPWQPSKGRERPEFAWLHPVEPELPADDTPKVDPITFDESLVRLAVGYVPRRHGGAPPPIALPVAPWLFQSTDRLARVLLTRTMALDMREGRVPEHCPVCGALGRAARREGDRTCSDPDCGTQWGTRTCDCGAVIPKVLPPLPRAEVLAEACCEMATPLARRHLMETLGGREMLADLCYSDEVVSQGSFWVICPTCGRCHRTERCGGGCVRCG